MKDALQNLLLYIPLHQLKFLTPLPKEPIYYEKISEHIPEQTYEDPTLLILQNDNEYVKLKNIDIANLLIQDANLAGIVICMQNEISLQEEILTLFTECRLPVIQMENPLFLKVFQQTNKLFSSYSQISKELLGFLEKGFPLVAEELAYTLGTPFLYLDENHQLIWQTGNEVEIREAKRWLNGHMKELEGKMYSNEICETITSEAKTMNNSYEFYSIDIAGMITHTLVVTANLTLWQKKMVDKLVGLMSLTLQTEEMLQEQQEKLKEHFVYDLLYHKFESQKEMIKQGKTWGWNLEKPQHLLLLNVELSNEQLTNIDWMNEIVLNIEMINSNTEEILIVFPFQDQIVILLQDDSERTISERKNYVLEIADFILRDISDKWPQFQFFFGIGKWYEDTINLNKEYQEAKLALQFGRIWSESKNIFYIHDLGILRLLLHIHHEILLDFCEEYLSLLLESDDKNGTEYIQTLKVYIQHQGNISEISEVLHVHRNTLRYRLKKIEEVIGINLQDTQDFINLVIAIKILSFLKL